MKTPAIQNVHVDHVSADTNKASAGFTLGEFRYHVWFNPRTLETDGPLYKNKITIKDENARTQRLDRAAAPNRAMLDEMWKQIRERELVRIALENDAIKRDAEKRAAHALERRRELCERAVYELEAVIDGRPVIALCDEESARVLLPFFRKSTRAPDSVLCLSLVDGLSVACFIPRTQ